MSTGGPRRRGCGFGSCSSGSAGEPASSLPACREGAMSGGRAVWELRRGEPGGGPHLRPVQDAVRGGGKRVAKPAAAAGHEGGGGGHRGAGGPRRADGRGGRGG